MTTPSSNPKKRKFAESFGYEIIHVVISPSTSSEPKQYYLHANKLRDASEYFAGLLRFPGVEKEQQKVTLSEGYEGLEDTFESFIEWMYAGSLVCEGLVDYAKMIVLAERLIAKELKQQALDYLDVNLKTPESKIPVTVAIQLIRIIYEGTHRPQSPATSTSTSNILAGGALTDPQTQVRHYMPPPPSPQKKQSSNYYSVSRGGGSTSTTAYGTSAQINPSVYSTSIANIVLLPQDRAGAQKAEGFRHRNCKARKMVAEFAANHLNLLRQCKSFRKVVEEIGEFASDLIMESLPSTCGNAVNVEIVDLKG